MTDRLTETLVQTDPDDWDISRDEIRYYYSLGVAYGLNNYVESGDGESENENADTDEPAQTA